jgi:CYTH domain-containing protein
MSIEIERKFLVTSLPHEMEGTGGHPIRQGYVIISDDDVELRIRQKRTQYFQTIKMGKGLSRTEIEISLSPEQFDRLWPYTAGRRVSKTRFTMPVGGHTAELDRFDGDLAGLVMVEVEFPSESAARAFVPPEWFGEEVTEDRRYKNKHLAVHGIPDTGD